VPTNSTSDRVVLYPSPSKMVFILVASVSFALGIGLFFSDVIDNPIFRYLPGSVAEIFLVGGMVLFSVAGISGLYRLLVPTPSVILDDDGLTIRSLAFSETRIPWAEILETKIRTFQGQRSLEITPKDAPSFINGLGAAKSNITKINSALGFAPIAIPAMMISCELEEVESLVRERLAAHR
jgi:hypothetical protein